MKCKSLDQAGFDEQNSRLRQLPLLAAGAVGAPVVRFRFNLAEAAGAGALFVIYSSRMRRAVYRGAYQQELVLPFAEVLAEDKGYDHLVFYFLQTGTRQYCQWLNDRAEQYWQNRAQIGITFLERVETDETELRRAFRVTVTLP